MIITSKEKSRLGINKLGSIVVAFIQCKQTIMKEKTSISFVGEEKLAMHMVVMDHKMCKIKNVFVEFGQCKYISMN
jgi:hypothetical protein